MEPLWNHCTASPHHRCDRVTDLELIFRQGLLDELEVLRHELPDASCRSNIREKNGDLTYVNICMYMYIYMYICIYVYVYMEICMNVYMYLCIYVYMYMYIWKYV